MSDPRFYVDERAGCVAVRDRTKTNPDYPGLHEHTAGVVKFWMGKWEKKLCPECGQSTFARWTVNPSHRAEAECLAKELNREAACQNNRT